MSTEPSNDPGDPTALPLFAAQAPHGRVRGTFSLRPAAQPSRTPAVLEDARRRHSSPRPAVIPSSAPRPTADSAEIDWSLVRALRTIVAGRLTKDHTKENAQDRNEAGPSAAGDRTAQEQYGRAVIDELLADHTADAVATGGQAWTGAQQARMAQAVFDAVFGLGRLQPLIDDDRVENIFVLGHRKVLLQLVDGTRIGAEPVADSDEELIDFLRFVANRSESNPRPFSEGTPRLHLKLDGGARLAATAWVVSVPTVVIRRHRLSIDSLAAWVDRDCMSPACADFLAAAVRAGWSTVVAGPMSAGKTTLMRALCAQIPPQEAIGTFETEYELFVDQAGRHEVVIDWESRPGMGEIGADGRAAGAFDLDDALVDSFRFALDRQIVGEIRGREVWTMIKAMESGTGSLSTTHASSAEACVHKLVTCAMETGGHVTRDLAMEKLAGCLDVIVQLDRKAVVLPDGTRAMRRWVREVAVVEPGEREKGYALTYLFGPSGNGPALATGVITEACRDLVAHGFDLDAYQAEADAGWSR
ncbi:MAG: CpaF/VirB11 family protein [Actinomycetales bacterium]|nr:CpaF/VirB11 family protein [Actinomycetales bacterium]